jgi:hypothetical protein
VDAVAADVRVLVGRYVRRHQVLGLARRRRPPPRRKPHNREPRSLVRRMSDGLETRKGAAAVRWARDRRSRVAPSRVARGPRRASAVHRPRRPAIRHARPPCDEAARSRCGGAGSKAADAHPPRARGGAGGRRPPSCRRNWESVRHG